MRWGCSGASWDEREDLSAGDAKDEVFGRMLGIGVALCATAPNIAKALRVRE